MMITLANEFAERGFEVDLLLAQKEGPLLEYVSEKVRVVDLQASRLLWSLWPAVKYLRHTRPEVLVGSMEHVVMISVLAKWLSWSRVKIIARVANTLSVSLQGTKWHRRLIRRYGAFVFYRLVDEVVCNSQGSAEDLARLMHLSPESLKVIYNPTVTPEMKRKAEEGVDHIWLNDDRFKVVLGVGRLHEQKDFETLIKAFARLKHTSRLEPEFRERLKLLILGEGKKREKLENLVRELGLKGEVDLPGFVKNSYAVMARSDVYVLSSRWEGLPNTLIEALAVGTPVVSTDCPSGPREILEGGKFGRLTPVGEVEPLSEAIKEALETSLGLENREQHIQQFSAESSTDRYISLVNTVTEGEV